MSDFLDISLVPVKSWFTAAAFEFFILRLLPESVEVTLDCNLVNLHLLIAGLHRLLWIFPFF